MARGPWAAKRIKWAERHGPWAGYVVSTMGSPSHHTAETEITLSRRGLIWKRKRNLRIAAAGEPLHPLPLSAGLSPSHRIDFLAVFSKACGRVGIVEIWAGAIDLRRHGVPRGLPSQ